MKTHVLSATQLRALLSYDHETGLFTWRVATGCVKAGKVAGCLDKTHGYIEIRIRSVRYYAHRLAWLYVTGEWPQEQVDHINRNTADNRFVNLRKASLSQQRCNSKLRADNLSRIKGVDFLARKKSKQWRAQIRLNGRCLFTKCFDTAEEAAAAYERAAREHHGEFARTV